MKLVSDVRRAMKKSYVTEVLTGKVEHVCELSSGCETNAVFEDLFINLHS
jgi:hypothetical protein